MVARGSDVGGSWGGKERWLPNKKKEKEEEEEGNRGRKRSQRNKKMTELGSENGKGRRRNGRCGVFFYEANESSEVEGIIGAILDSSSRIGQEHSVAINLALEDFNIKNNLSFALHVRNSQGDPLLAAIAGAPTTTMSPSSESNHVVIHHHRHVEISMFDCFWLFSPANSISAILLLGLHNWF
ncbi:hypothetical protein JHK85_016634 [Glycine max]|nr:hypothetical protein JHK85_016634 [Glycine max]KAG5046857.1 hypothetical protein JHK86_016263 [Glycine max]